MPEYYRNEALFSEIYLEEITEQPEKEETAISFKVLGEYREYVDVDNLEDWEKSYIREVFSALGFALKKESEFVYLLSDIGKPENILSICVMLSPDENLNNSSMGRNWMEKTIRALRNHEKDWGLLTNGKQWRILHQDEAQPYETFLEIDLEEIIQDNSGDAFRIFFQFMKAQNFINDAEGKCKFDQFKQDSKDKVDYIEKELANSLKPREEGGKGVLSDICMGYVKEMRRGNIFDFSDEKIRTKIYHGAMLYMFRLLFLFYADARGLLSETNRGILTAIKKTCKKLNANGNWEEEQYVLWKQLDEIFVDIDQTYNGGLFSPQESDFTRFISETRISDQYLANATYYLTTYRERNQEIKNISYRDMSVRHLGTLYEGLLEHKLFIAEEDTEVKLSRNKIRFIPKSQGGKLVVGKYIKSGEVYFASDSNERKESGSFYTTEVVVDYIVEHIVGQRLCELENQFFKVEADLIDALKNTSNKEEKKSLSALFEEKILNFVKKEILQLSVLDPAMGSGHFLINATNRITNFIIRIMNSSSTEENTTTEPHFWRRRVVENCIYGVDVNPLAVELAKLSLWILSMAKDRPLSFLNHNLKCGDSLIGGWLDKVGIYPLKTEKQEKSQPSLYQKDPEFKEVYQKAVEKISFITSGDSQTLADIVNKKIWLEEFDQLIKEYKNVFNFHTSVFFGDSLNESDYQAKLTLSSIKVNQISDNRYFHWELEFPLVFAKNNGFDCVVGNPPYVDIKVDQYYKLNYLTSKGSNLYNIFTEQALRLINKNHGRFGYIVPISLISSERMRSTRNLIRKNRGEAYFVNIDSSAHPGTLFDGLNLRLSIVLIRLNEFQPKMRIFSSDFTKFFNHERDYFLEDISFVEISDDLITDSVIPKISSQVEIDILQKLFANKENYFSFKVNEEENHNALYYKGTGYNYMLAFESPPFFEVNGQQKQNSKTKVFLLRKDINLKGAILVFSTSLFYWFWTVYSNCFDFTKNDFKRFPINLEKINTFENEVDKLYIRIQKSLKENSRLVTYNKANGVTRYYEYRARETKSLFDEVDDILATIYGFNKEELTFIKNYDLRFRTDD